jgi:hypothetical protein
MDPEYERFFRTPVRFRIIEKRTRVLEEFAASINSNKLLSVACEPRSWADRKRCFVNVETKVARDGGRMLTGWIFNEYEHRSIEGEAHAIWEDRFGKKRIDITPHDFQPKRVLFLPDPRVAIKRGYTAHPRTLLSDDPKLVAIEAFDDAMQKLRESRFHGFGTEMVILREDYEKARDDAGLPDEVARHLFQKYCEADERAIQMYGSPPRPTS